MKATEAGGAEPINTLRAGLAGGRTVEHRLSVSQAKAPNQNSRGELSAPHTRLSLRSQVNAIDKKESNNAREK